MWTNLNFENSCTAAIPYACPFVCLSVFVVLCLFLYLSVSVFVVKNRLKIDQKIHPLFERLETLVKKLFCLSVSLSIFLSFCVYFICVFLCSIYFKCVFTPNERLKKGLKQDALRQQTELLVLAPTKNM